MKIDYLYRHKEFKKVLEKELDRLIKGEINQIRIKNIPSDVFCEATGCETNDFNGWIWKICRAIWKKYNSI